MTSPKVLPGEKHWRIHVVCWGTLFAVGTEAQAEEWRQHKAGWEGCVARKRLATPEEIRAEKFARLAELLG
jgi:hypothetical protein